MNPAESTPLDLSVAAEQTISSNFQSKLLRLRLLHLNTIKNSPYDPSLFVPTMREDVSAIVTPLLECSDLKSSILDTLLAQSNEITGKKLIDLDSVVVEALIFYCHKSDTKFVFVRDLTKCANAILEGRNAEPTESDKRIGLTLRGLGLHSERVTAGYRLRLTDSVRMFIHKLAVKYAVASIADGIVRCSHCR